MNQSSAADQGKTATKKPTTYVVNLPNRSVALLKVGQFKYIETKPPASTSSKLAAKRTSVLPTATSAKGSSELSVKYRTILEDLLRLRIDLVTKSISAAIKSVIVADVAQTTSDDWLLVIFKALERILCALDVGLIYSNESHLVATSRLIYRLIETSKLLELVENRIETRDFQQFFTRKMSGVLSQVSMEAVYKSAQEIFESKRRSSYAQVIIFRRPRRNGTRSRNRFLTFFVFF